VYFLEDGKILKQTTSENGLFYFYDLNRNYSSKLIAKSVEPKQQVKIRILSYRLAINPLAAKSLNNIHVEEIVKETVKEEGKIKLREEAEKKFRKRLPQKEQIFLRKQTFPIGFKKKNDK
jgi:hypothetical protein